MSISSGRPPRPLFSEANKLGLLAAGATVGAPLGQVLSAEAQHDLGTLLTEIEDAGLAFSHHPNPNNGMTSGVGYQPPEEVAKRVLDSRGQFGHWCLNVSIKPPPPRAVGYGDVSMNMARVGSLYELQAMETLAVHHQAGTLQDGQALLDLEAAGNHFFLDPNRNPKWQDMQGSRCRAVGPYGAWRALNIEDGWDDAESLFAGKPASIPTRLHNQEDLRVLAFFELGHPHPQLETDVTATTLRDLTARGIVFEAEVFRVPLPFTPEQAKPDYLNVSPAEVYRRASGNRLNDLRVGVGGGGSFRLSRELLMEPSSLHHLADWNAKHVVARRQNGEFNQEEAQVYLETLSQSLGTLSLQQRGELLEHLLAAETTASPQRLPLVRDSARAVARVLRDGESWEFAAQQLIDLRQYLQPAEALQAFPKYHNSGLTMERFLQDHLMPRSRPRTDQLTVVEEGDHVVLGGVRVPRRG